MQRAKTRTCSELFLEWSPRLEARSGLMLPFQSLDTVLKQRDPGYGSVYLFDKKAADEITARKSSRNFSQYEVAAGQLIIDLDGGDAALARAKEVLGHYRHTVYSSGGKGYHMVLPHELIIGRDVPAAHRQLVESLAIPTADVSLYRHGSIVSLPGRVHPKTGKRKTLVEEVDGEMIVIPDPRPEPVFVAREGDISNLTSAMLQAASIIETEPGPGARHQSLWSLSLSYRDAGMPQEWVETLLLEINNQWSEPKPEEEVLRAVDQAFKR